MDYTVKITSIQTVTNNVINLIKSLDCWFLGCVTNYSSKRLFTLQRNTVKITNIQAVTNTVINLIKSLDCWFLGCITNYSSKRLFTLQRNQMSLSPQSCTLKTTVEWISETSVITYQNTMSHDSKYLHQNERCQVITAVNMKSTICRHVTPSLW